MDPWQELDHQLNSHRSHSVAMLHYASTHDGACVQTAAWYLKRPSYQGPLEVQTCAPWLLHAYRCYPTQAQQDTLRVRSVESFCMIVKFRTTGEACRLCSWLTQGSGNVNHGQQGRKWRTTVTMRMYAPINLLVL